MNEFDEDLDTERLLLAYGNEHSVYHICPTHGVGIDMPMTNTCPDCRLYISGKDVRKLMTNMIAAGKMLEMARHIGERKISVDMPSGLTANGDLYTKDTFVRHCELNCDYKEFFHDIKGDFDAMAMTIKRMMQTIEKK